MKQRPSRCVCSLNLFIEGDVLEADGLKVKLGKKSGRRLAVCHTIDCLSVANL
jgi:hypothetical protein